MLKIITEPKIDYTVTGSDHTGWSVRFNGRGLCRAAEWWSDVPSDEEGGSFYAAGPIHPKSKCLAVAKFKPSFRVRPGKIITICKKTARKRGGMAKSIYCREAGLK